MIITFVFLFVSTDNTKTSLIESIENANVLLDMSDKDYWYIVDIQGDISNEVDYDFINFDGNEPLLIDENKSEVLKHCIKKAFPDKNFDVSK